MRISKTLSKLKEELDNPCTESLNLSLNNVHGENIFSLVVSGNEFGNLKRVFICDRKLKPIDVQFHTHRYDLILTVLKGAVYHHTLKISESSTIMPMFFYKSPLNGGNGLMYDSDVQVLINDSILPVGSTVLLSCDEFHTMSCSKGSMWLVQELGFKRDCSQVIGMPFITDGLYKSPEMFQINDMVQRVKKEVKHLLTVIND